MGTILSAFICCLLLFTGLASAQTCDCDISAGKVQAYDALLNLDQAEKAEAVATHLPWGIPLNPPTATHEHLLYQADYVFDYDDDLRVPIWAGYRLTKGDVEAHLERTECFRNDPRLPDQDAAFCADYDEPVFDRGHLVPNADMTRGESDMINTYMFSNMTPQYANFNRIIWSRLEGFVRNWAKVKGQIYVISGVVFDRNSDGHRDPDAMAVTSAPTHRVAIPTAYYKIILYERPNGYIESMAFLLPHDNVKHTGKAGEAYLGQHLTSIDEIEAETGIDFLPILGQENPGEKASVEKSVAERMWPRK